MSLKTSINFNTKSTYLKRKKIIVTDKKSIFLTKSLFQLHEKIEH